MCNHAAPVLLRLTPSRNQASVMGGLLEPVTIVCQTLTTRGVRRCLCVPQAWF